MLMGAGQRISVVAGTAGEGERWDRQYRMCRPSTEPYLNPPHKTNKTTLVPASIRLPQTKLFTQRGKMSMSCGNDLMYVRDSGLKRKTMCLKRKTEVLLSYILSNRFQTPSQHDFVSVHLFIAIIPIVLCGCTWKISYHRSALLCSTLIKWKIM